MSWFYSLLGYDEANAQAASDADTKLRALNEAKAAERGAAWEAEVSKNYQTQVAFGVDAQKKEINVAFKEGLQDGANNITGFVSGVFSFVGKALGAILLGIPVWVWVTAAGALWVYLGTPGLKQLKKKLA